MYLELELLEIIILGTSFMLFQKKSIGKKSNIKKEKNKNE